jgi:hypothetical protein
MKQFLIEIASVPDREYLVAEIWYNEQMIAEVNQEKGDLVVEFYMKEKISFNYDSFCEALQQAREKLLKE